MSKNSLLRLWSIHVIGSFVTQILLRGPYMMWMVRTSVDILDVVASYCAAGTTFLNRAAMLPSLHVKNFHFSLFEEGLGSSESLQSCMFRLVNFAWHDDDTKQ